MIDIITIVGGIFPIIIIITALILLLGGVNHKITDSLCFVALTIAILNIIFETIRIISACLK